MMFYVLIERNIRTKKFALILWCLTPLSTIFQLYHGSHFYLWSKPEYPEKITDKQYHIIFHMEYMPP